MCKAVYKLEKALLPFPRWCPFWEMVVRWGVSRRFLASHRRLQVIFGRLLSTSRSPAMREHVRRVCGCAGVFAGVCTPLERNDLFCLCRHPFRGCTDIDLVTLRRKHVLLSNTPGTRATAPCNNVTMYFGGGQGKGNIGYTSGIGKLQELKNRKVEAEGEVRRGCSRQKNPKPWEPLGSRCGTLLACQIPTLFGL
jgi:hypothetical protein